MSSVPSLSSPATPTRATRSNDCRRTTAARARAAKGFSLVELMVAMTIGLLIIVGLTAMYVSSVSGKKTDARFAEFQTNARFAMDAIKRDIQTAGFAAFSNVDLPPNKTILGLMNTDISGCGAGFATKLEERISGYNGSKGINCVPSGDYEAGTDVLILRRIGPECIGSTPPCTGSIANDRLYVRSTTSQSVFPTTYQGNAAPTIKNGGFPEDFELHADIYFIRQCTNLTTCESPKVPALYRMSLKPGPSMEADLVASNIEDMQLQYGVNTYGLNPITGKREVTSVQLYDANLVPDWSRVGSVRIWLLARSSEKDPGFSGTQTFSYADKKVFTKNDGYQRQLFQQVFQIRETPN